MPCFLITSLGLLTFVLPPNTGERVTLVITTLLAMTVFMLMIAEKTPTTSKVTPLIGKFFIASMVIIGLSLIATCVVLNLYECSRAVESVPKPIRVLVLEYLAPLLRVDPPIQKRMADPSSSVKSSEVFEGAANHHYMDTSVTNGSGKGRGGAVAQLVTGSANWNFHQVNNNYHNQEKTPNSNSSNNNSNLDEFNFTRSNHFSSSTKDCGGDSFEPGCRQRNMTSAPPSATTTTTITEVLPREISEGIAVLSERAKQQEKFDELTEEWQAVAKVADRFFLIVFLCTITIASVYLFSTRPSPDDL